MLTRRGLLTAFVVAPAIVRATSLMPVRELWRAGGEPFLPCDGRLVSRWAYRELFAAIGRTYGADGDRFRLPTLNGHYGDFKHIIMTGGLPLKPLTSDRPYWLAGLIAWWYPQ